MKSKRTTREQFTAAWRKAVPLVAVEMSDPAATFRTLAQSIPKDRPIFVWDCVSGVRSMNSMADAIIKQVFGETEDDWRRYGNPVEFLHKCRQFDENNVETCLPEKTFVFMHNMQRFTDDSFVMQAIWNLRDWFASKGSMLVLFYSITKLPDELTQDVIVIQDPLPDRKQIVKDIESVLKDASAATPPEAEMERLVEMCTGLSSFTVRQTIAIALEKVDDKLSVDSNVVWDTKCNSIGQTSGLKVYEGPEDFSTIGGCDNAKMFFSRLKDSPDRPCALMLIDEIEKQMGGSTGPIGDTSGTSQDQLGVLLTTMQDYGLSGWLEFGPAGASKTVFAKALAAELKIPLLMCDLGAMKASLVGESERKIRAAMRVFLSVSNGRGMIIGTCNKFINLPPELRRRFTNGLWFFDLPTADEQELIWPIYLKKYGLKGKPKFNYAGWTGAEIKACAETAWRFSMSLEEASRFVTPVCKSAADVIKQMRGQADGKFISAGKPGFYQQTSTISTEVEGRRMEL